MSFSTATCVGITWSRGLVPACAKQRVHSAVAAASRAASLSFLSSAATVAASSSSSADASALSSTGPLVDILTDCHYKFHSYERSLCRRRCRPGARTLYATRSGSQRCATASPIETTAITRALSKQRPPMRARSVIYARRQHKMGRAGFVLNATGPPLAFRTRLERRPHGFRDG